MLFLLQPLQVALAVLSESIRNEQEKVIEYLQLENQILREKLGGKRVLLSDDQRRVLAVKGKALGRQQLGKIATIAQADTILRWHRELVKPQGVSKARHHTGRPPKEQEVVDLVLRMARENVCWGYKRIEGSLHNLGYDICSSTVANILKQHGIEPAPTRKRTTSWSTFLKAHWDVFEGLDLDAITLWLSELASYVFGHISHSRAIPCPAIMESNDEAPRPTILTIPIVRVPKKATQPTRGPPTVAQPSISPREIRHAA
jgi:putative transposase